MTSKNKLFDEVDVLNGLNNLTKFYIRLNEYYYDLILKKIINLKS